VFLSGVLGTRHLLRKSWTCSISPGSDQHVVTVAAQDQIDLSAILDTGLAVAVEIDLQGDRPRLSITLPFSESTD
jgi:hypothetical protein